MKTIDNKSIEDAVVKIFNDHILWDRVSNLAQAITNAVHPSETPREFEPDNKYHGYGSAFDILGIRKEHELTEYLGEITHQLLKTSQKSSMILGKELYKIWLEEIKNYFVEKANVKVVV